MAEALAPALVQVLVSVSPWEALAVALAVAYLVLAIRENAWCWAAGIAGSAIYFVLFFRAALYMESVLQLFYVGVSVYGWAHWARGGARPGAALPVVTWEARRHALALGAIALLALANGALLQAYTPAALPYLDSLMAWGSVVTTWMVARKVLENWIYWFVIDGVSAGIYASRGLWLTALLFAGYLPLIVIGYRAWRHGR